MFIEIYTKHECDMHTKKRELKLFHIPSAHDGDTKEQITFSKTEPNIAGISTSVHMETYHMQLCVNKFVVSMTYVRSMPCYARLLCEPLLTALLQ